MNTKILISAVFVITAGTVLAWPQLQAIAKPQIGPKSATSHNPQPASGKPKVEVVFVLDTTSSMGGLIEAAKENIWSIASTMASAKPAPELKMGLVAFRDRGDDYVTRVSGLSLDLDSMYAKLMDLRPEGGGDGPESVNAALHAAVHEVQWSPDPQTYKVIFLVGDAPPHMDYQDEVQYPETIRLARSKGIVVNTILAGSDVGASEEWQRIAALNQGAFFQVEQSGSAVAVATPFDAEIAELSAALDRTRMFFGEAEEQAAMAQKVAASDKLHASGSVASRAKRAAFNASEAGAANLLGENELVDAVSSGRVDLAKLEADQLPPELKNLEVKQQQEVLAARAEQRADLDARIQKLNQQRQGYISEDLKKRGDTSASLDEQIFVTVREQAKDKGLKYEGKAAH